MRIGGRSDATRTSSILRHYLTSRLRSLERHKNRENELFEISYTLLSLSAENIIFSLIFILNENNRPHIDREHIWTTIIRYYIKQPF